MRTPCATRRSRCCARSVRSASRRRRRRRCAASFLVEVPEAYERLLLDCMIGDPTLFTRADEVETAWKLIDPIEAAWRDDHPPLHIYDSGTWGPAASAKLLEQDGREWHRP